MRLQQPDIIKDVFSALRLDVSRINFFFNTTGRTFPGSAFSELLGLRNSGNLAPVIILGFDHVKNLHERQRTILEDTGNSVFYLRLPCSLEQLRAMFSQAAEAADAKKDFLDRQEAVGRIRAFKHSCDNIDFSRSMTTNQAKVNLIDAPGQVLAEMREFNSKHMGRLVQEYNDLSDLVEALALPGADALPGLFGELRELIEKIEAETTDPAKAVEHSFSFIEKIQRISTILDKARVQA